MSSLPVEGWAHEQVTYRHLIRPVVAFVRDNGPVPADQVLHLISKAAAGDLNFASPTGNRPDAARRTLNLLAADIDKLEVDTDADMVSVPADVNTVHSAMFGEWEIPSAEVLAANREESQRKRLLREWVGRHLFATEWRNGIRAVPVRRNPGDKAPRGNPRTAPREYDPTEVTRMVEQIQRFGYVGPKIVRDADLGTIIDGGLRAAALKQLGMSVADHSVSMSFDNDMHRLAYVLAAHAVPGNRNRVPVSLRDAILREVLPRGAGLLRGKGGSIVEPTIDDWLDITDRDFTTAPVAVTVVEHVTDADVPDGQLADQILAVTDPDEWVGYTVVIERLYTAGIKVLRVDNAMQHMVEAGQLEQRGGKKAGGGPAEFRPRLIRVPVVKPVAAGRKELPIIPRTAKEVGMRVLVENARKDPTRWTRANDLDHMVTDFLKREKLLNAAYHLGNTVLWSVDGDPWRVEKKKDGAERYLRAVTE